MDKQIIDMKFTPKGKAGLPKDIVIEKSYMVILPNGQKRLVSIFRNSKTHEIGFDEVILEKMEK